MSFDLGIWCASRELTDAEGRAVDQALCAPESFEPPGANEPP